MVTTIVRVKRPFHAAFPGEFGGETQAMHSALESLSLGSASAATASAAPPALEPSTYAPPRFVTLRDVPGSSALDETTRGAKRIKCELVASNVPTSSLDAEVASAAIGTTTTTSAHPPRKRPVVDSARRAFDEEHEKAHNSSSARVNRALEARAIRNSENRDALRRQARVLDVDSTVAAPSGVVFDDAFDFAIWDACTTGNFQPIFELIDFQKKNVNYQRSRAEKTTSLHAAVLRGEVEYANALLVRGADPALKDAYGKTPEDYIEGIADSSAKEAMEKIFSMINEERYDIYIAVDEEEEEENEPSLMESEEQYVVLDAATRDLGLFDVDAATGTLIEIVHDAYSSGPDFDDLDSDSNEEDYYENKLVDEEESDESDFEEEESTSSSPQEDEEECHLDDEESDRSDDDFEDEYAEDEYFEGDENENE